MTTFAQELITPFALDTTNNLTSLLLGDGVGIFISDDNLTTVTNVVDGSAGVATDITNNERGVASGDYRIGFDYSSRTAQEQTELDTDPYQLFRTDEDEILDYGLTFNGVDQYVTFDPTNIGATIGDYVEIDCTVPPDPDTLISTVSGFKNQIGWRENIDANLIYARFGTNTYVELALAKPATGTRVKLRLERPDLTSWDLYSDDVYVGNMLASANFNANCLGGSGLTFYTAHTYYGLKVKRAGVITDLLDFNRTQGSVAPNLIGDVNGTLFNFPTDDGYVIENGEITGYALNDVAQTITLAMTGAYTGTITYSDDTTAAISGSGNHVLDGTTPIVIKKVIATDAVNSFDWDFTTGDVDQIIELLQGSDAATPAKTSGWMPIIDTQVYTIGVANADYSTLAAFVTAQNNQTTVFVDGLVTSDLVISGAEELKLFGGGVRLRGDITFEGDHNVVRKLTGGLSVKGLDATNPNIFIEDLYIENTTSPAFSRDTNQQGNIFIERVALSSTTVNTVAGALPGLGTVTLKDCLVFGSERYGVLGSATYPEGTIVLDSIVTGCNTLGSRASVRYANAINTIVDDVNGAFEDVTGSNNISSDASATTAGIGTGNVDFTGAFIDG